MTIHWKAVEQYFTVVLFVNPLAPRVKPWVIQSFLIFDSMDRTLSVTIRWTAVKQCFTVVLFFVFTQFVILENVSILDLALSGVKGLSLFNTNRLSWYLMLRTKLRATQSW